MNECKYQLPFKHDKYCMAYHESQREDKRKWTHFPSCKDEHCPLQHPELLEDAKLETEV